VCGFNASNEAIHPPNSPRRARRARNGSRDRREDRRRDDDPRTIAPTVAAWPADADGLFRIALPHRDLTILWRAWALAAIAAGRGARAAADEYAAKLNLTIGPDLTDAYDYVATRLAGRGVHGTNGSRTGWTQSAMWVLRDGETRKPYRRYEARGWRSRARAHEACAATGLALPGATHGTRRQRCCF
jgi:hypothetical protein